MTTSELISYIKNQIKNNISKELITSKLLEAGWRIEDINEGFLMIEDEQKPKIEVKKEEPNIIPAVEQKPVQEPKIQSDGYREPINKEEPKVWIPKNVPIIEQKPAEELKPQIPIQKETHLVVDSIELPKGHEEELLPTLKKPVVSESFETFPVKEEIESKPIVNEQPVSKTNFSISDLPKIAMMSSYQKDMQFAEKENDDKTKKRHSALWIILVFIAAVIAFATWSIVSGHVSLRDFYFIKKNPKDLLLENSQILSSLKSYKTETNIEVSSPTFSLISSALISGEPITSQDRDSITINSLGVINQADGEMLSDNFVTIKGTMLQEQITTDIKNDGENLFISVPDLKQILKENAPQTMLVEINEEEFKSVPPLFKEGIESKINKINLYRLLSSGISSYVNNETIEDYNNLVNKIEITEKGLETIKGVETYHYALSIDRETGRDFLSNILDNFVLDLNDEEKDKLEDIIGSASVKSLDVWVGKGDNNIYQYNLILDIPLSKVISFEDASVSGSKVTINWKTTYYDFDIPNEIFIPTGAGRINQFLSHVKQMKIKNELVKLHGFSKNLINALGSFGKASNTKGSCMSPVSGSMFSPTGHPRGALTPISSISEVLNKVLEETAQNGTCFSTTKGWSFSVPISDLYDPSAIYTSYMCIDDKGEVKMLQEAPKGIVCE